MILRQKYIDKIFEYANKPIIKVITGLRKVGKSTLLQQYIEKLKAKRTNINVVFVDFNDFDTLHAINNADELNNFMKKHYNISKMNYFFIDEIQEIKEFQTIINS
jgi:predicted AAA+ superfamily ATPase